MFRQWYWFLEKITVSLEKSSDRTSEKIVSIDNDIVVLKQNTNELEKGISFTNNMCDELKKQISSLTLANNNLTKTVDGLLNQVDMNEQHSRSECLLLHGVPEGKSETPKQSIDLFTKNISQHIGYDIHPDLIRRAHWLGQANHVQSLLVFGVPCYEMISTLIRNCVKRNLFPLRKI